MEIVVGLVVIIAIVVVIMPLVGGIKIMRLSLIGGRQIKWAALVPLGVLLGCVLLSVQVYEYAWVCDRETGGALAEFPAFGDADIEPRPDTMNHEDCNATFSTTAPADRVVGYYRRQLSSHGWQVRTVPREEQVENMGLPEADVPHRHVLWAERGDVCYNVSVTFSSQPGSPGNQSVLIGAKDLPPGGMLHPPHHKC